MRLTRRATVLWGLVSLSMLTQVPTAFAIVPTAQVVLNPGNVNLNSVVQFDTAAVQVGTGTIICKYVGANGDGFFALITADHVVSAPPPIADRIGFLNSTVLGGPAAGPNNNLLIGQIFHGGFTGNEDVAVLAVDYGKAPDAFFNGVATLSYASIANPTGRQFTSIGFGNTGTSDGAGGYNETLNSGGTKRFQNNVVTGFAAGQMHAGYTYTDVQWQLDNPGIAGEGFVYRGDSGGPLLTTNPITLGGVANVFTDTIFGITTFGPTGHVVPGSTETDLLLTANDITWINRDLQILGCPVPEPSSFALLAMGGLGILAWRRRVSKAA
jgi:hypothetical protein